MLLNRCIARSVLQRQILQAYQGVVRYPMGVRGRHDAGEPREGGDFGLEPLRGEDDVDEGVEFGREGGGVWDG